MTNAEKAHFIKTDVPRLLEDLRAKATPWWGVMSAQNMLEHLSWSLQNSTGKVVLPLATAPEKLEAAKAYLMDDSREYKPNVKHPHLKETPEPLKFRNIIEAYENFTEELNNFFEYYANHPGKTNVHPAYGDLNYEEWVQCHYKHFVHHLKQFDLMK